MDQPDSPPTLMTALASFPATRSRRGRAYDLPAILNLCVVALLCGYRGYRAFAQWGRLYNHLAPMLGFNRPRRDGRGCRTPCFSDLATVFEELDDAALEDALRRWLLVQGLAELPQRTVAIEGKTASGSRRGELLGTHLLAAYCREAEAVLAQLHVLEASNEHKAALELLKNLPLEGTVLTGDAAFCQRDLCRAAVDGGGDDVVAVKANQPALQADIAAGFARAFSPGGARPTAAARRRGRGTRYGAWPPGAAAVADHDAAGRLPRLAGGAAGRGGGADADDRDGDRPGGGLRHHQPAAGSR